MISINLNLLENIKASRVEQLFGMNLKETQWVWVNKEIFSDLVLNAVEYDAYDEIDIDGEINKINEEEFLKILRDKMKEINWVEMNQLLFERIEAGFKATEDIKTYIFAEKRYFMLQMIGVMKELQWMLKAMAVDSYQHLTPEGKLISVYEEDFQDNFMILEEIIVNGMYQKNNCIWKVVAATNSLVFYKNKKQYRVWAEGNANFIFNELSK